MIKRLFDIIVSGLAIVILSPVFVIVAILIVITGGFPIIFCQSRVGKNRKNFTVYKFRTMNVAKSISKQGDLGNNKRITTIGKFLRKTKIDEFPQLWNVLRGDMSIVGPRPELEYWTKIYKSRWDKVLTIRPGITDEASIIYKNEEHILSNSKNPTKAYEKEILPAKLSSYEEYVDNNNLFVDLKIIIKTIIAVIR